MLRRFCLDSRIYISTAAYLSQPGSFEEMDFASQLSSLKRKVSAVTDSKEERHLSDHRRTDGAHSRTTSSSHRSYTANHRPIYSQSTHQGSSDEYRLQEEENLIKTIRDISPEFIEKGKTLITTNSSSDSTKPKHIALLFITIDDLPFESIWRRWLQDFTTEHHHPLLHVSVLCHAKYPERVQSSWLKDRLLILQPPFSTSNGSDSTLPPPKYHTYRPEWGSVEITRAMMDLLQEALRIGTVEEAEEGGDMMNNDWRYSTLRYLATQQQQLSDLCESSISKVDRFMFLSESCLPVTSLFQVYHSLFEMSTISPDSINNDTAPINHHLLGKSWIHARNSPNNGFSRQSQWDTMSKAIPRECIWKADQWMVLTRFHAWCICSIIDEATRRLQETSPSKMELWKAFGKVRASDEMFVPTVMALLGLIPSPSLEMNGTQQVNTPIVVYPPFLGEGIVNRRVTYCDWTNNAKNPETFILRKDDDESLKRIIHEAQEEGCLFARKFKLQGRASVHSLAEDAIAAKEWMEIIYKDKTTKTEIS